MSAPNPQLVTEDVAAFAAAMPNGGRLAGLDLGTRTIGVAFCDARWSFATPAETLKRGKFTADLERLAALFTATGGVSGIVLGLPLNLDGSPSPRAQASRAFARNLSPLALPVLLWDERWSTQAVTRQMIAEDRSRASRAEMVDKMAAAYLLQGAIDALAHHLARIEGGSALP